MNTNSLHFHRLFSQTFYKCLKLPLSEMTFTKDFVNDTRGDLYPVIRKNDTCVETIRNNQYVIASGTAERMMCSFFPFATYEISFSLSQGSCGFGFYIKDAKASIIYDGENILFHGHDQHNGAQQRFSHKTSCRQSVTMIVSCHPQAFDIYFVNNHKPEYLCSFICSSFGCSNQEDTFKQGYVTVIGNANTTIYTASSYIDCGISQADIRPIRYENGDVIYENGKIHFSASIRMQEGTFQGIFSWIPGTSKFELTGALFFCSGDGFWRNFVASSILFNRTSREWYLWVSSFAHKHILCHSAFRGDPRFGVNIIDVTFMDPASNEDITSFTGFKGDEDPDFYYDEQDGKWYMAICRLDPSIKSYKYFFYKSDDPFLGYTYIGKGMDGGETGGSFVTFKDTKIFACGNDFNKRADYRIYTKDGMSNAVFDFDDGGFRGWGTIIPVEIGSRKRYFWLTFDRHNGSTYNWSYGNIYCFEAVLFN